MSDVAFICPNCGHTYEFSAQLAGKRGRCKECRAVFRIPAPSSQRAAPPAAPAARQASTAPSPVAGPASRPPWPSDRMHAAEEGRIIFTCPACGHGYRLDAKLAGKKGRCTTCRGVFTIPTPSPPGRATALVPTPAPSSHRRVPGADPSAASDPERIRARARAGTTRSGMPPTSAPGGPPPDAAVPSAGDSGWWELDSSESIPTAAVRAGAGRSRSVAAPAPPVAPSASADRARLGPQVDDEGPIVTAKPVRRAWVKYAAVAAGVLVGAIAYAITYSLVSSAVGPAPRPVADPPRPETKPAPTPPTIADVPKPDPGPVAVPQPSGPEAQHREAVDDLIRAYNQIADGYARIRDANSIPRGGDPIDRGVEQLRTAARRGRSLPSLSPGERAAVIRWGAPPLLGAIDRVLRELRRLKATPGLRSDFDRLIDAYSKAREEVLRELEHH